MRECECCGSPIPEERLEALPGTVTCVKCSRVKPLIGFTCYDHKTAPGLVLVNPDDREALRLAKRVHNRSR